MTFKKLPDDLCHTCVGVTVDVQKKFAEAVRKLSPAVPQYVIVNELLTEWVKNQEADRGKGKP